MRVRLALAHGPLRWDVKQAGRWRCHGQLESGYSLRLFLLHVSTGDAPEGEVVLVLDFKFLLDTVLPEVGVIDRIVLGVVAGALIAGDVDVIAGHRQANALAECHAVGHLLSSLGGPDVRADVLRRVGLGHIAFDDIFPILDVETCDFGPNIVCEIMGHTIDPENSFPSSARLLLGSRGIDLATVNADSVYLRHCFSAGKTLSDTVFPDCGHSALLVVGWLDITSDIDILPVRANAVRQGIRGAVSQVLRLAVRPKDDAPVIFRSIESRRINLAVSDSHGDRRCGIFPVADDGFFGLVFLTGLEFPDHADILMVRFVVTVINKVSGRLAANDVDRLAVSMDPVAESVVASV